MLTEQPTSAEGASPLHEPFFSAERDKEVEKAGGFWCHACLVSHPADRQSPDPRYCQRCYDLLLKEAEKDNTHWGGDWRPLLSSHKPLETPLKVAQVSESMQRIKSTLESSKIEADKTQPSVAVETPSKHSGSKRGRKPKELPEDLIARLAGKGMGSKAIASQLKAHHNITVSYKTVQRILAGQQVLIRPPS